MVLWITDRDVEMGITDYKVSYEEFASREYHPFIATTKWDCVNVELVPDMPQGILKQLVPRTKIKPIYDIDNVNMKVAALLGEIYPDSRAQLMSYYMKGSKEQLKELLLELGKIV